MTVCFLRMALAAALATALLACGDDDARPTDSGPPMVDASLDAGTPVTDSGPRDAGTMGDGNESFADAVEIMLNDPDGAMETINPGGDEDFFRFTGTAGTWVIIDTEANPEDDNDMVDTVITLYDATMTQIAENDDGQPRASTDSEIIIRLPSDGTYYAMVQEWSTWAGETPEAGPTFTYQITVAELNLEAAVVTADAETGDEVANATDLNTSMDFGITVGTFEDATDVDYFRFTVGGTDARFVRSVIMPWGTDGYGSTSSAGTYSVLNEAGDTVITRIDHTTGTYNQLGPSLAPGTYLLRIDHPGTTAGANDFYVLKTLFLNDNPPEEDDSGNGTLDSAEALSVEAGDGVRSGFILVEIEDGDVDYFSFDVMAGEVVTVSCGSIEYGAGLRMLRAELRSSADAVLRDSTESGPDSLLIEEATVPSAGTYYLRLSAGTPDSEITSRIARCAVRMTMP